MKESKIIFFVCSFLAVLSVFFVYISTNELDFNFYKSEITINGAQVNERLFYSPDKPYHTLYRNFLDPINLYPGEIVNGASIVSVSCLEGTPYLYSGQGKFFTFNDDLPKESAVLPYTESNEIGCTFGDYYGFQKGKQYTIDLEYYISSQNLFIIDEKPYMKFVAYSPDNHVKLNVGKNFIINGKAEYNSVYSSKDSVVIYVPFEEDLENRIVIKLQDFEYDNNYSRSLLIYFFGLIPSILLFLIWYLFGKENSEIDELDSSSIMPNKRKPWQVAAYFHPPFNVLDKEFMSSLVIDLFKRKIIDIKIEEGIFKKNCYIKLLNEETVDSIERSFIHIIKSVSESYKGKYFEEGYVNLANPGIFKRYEIIAKFKAMQKEVESIGKGYQDTKGAKIAIFFMFILVYPAFIFGYANLVFLPIISLFIVIFLANYTSVFIRFKGEYYQEYSQWQAFKKYLNNAPSLKLHGHRGVIVWGEYLTYATALGVSDRVIKELKEQGVVSDQDYGAYITASHFSSAIISSGTMGSSSGGHGGAGGGGVGGGGGGGR